MISCVEDATVQKHFARSSEVRTCSYSVLLDSVLHKPLLKTTPVFGATLGTNAHSDLLIASGNNDLFDR